MRIAHFCQRYPPAPGGSEAYFAKLSEYLVAQGHSVTVFTSDAHDLEAFWNRNAQRLPTGQSFLNGVEIQRYPLRHYLAHRYWLKVLSLVPIRSWQCRFAAHHPILPTLWKEVADCRQQFDLVHATAFPYGYPLICGLRLAQAQRIPFLLTPFVHTGDPENPHDPMRRGYTRPALLSLAHSAQQVFVQTHVEQQTLIDCGIDRQKLILQGMGVDLQECLGGNRTQIRQSWDVSESEVIIGHLANKSWEKGTIDLLKSASIAWERGADFRLVLAGPEMSNFREFWKTYADAHRVICLPWLSEEQKRDFFAGIDIFALPSRSDSFGIVLLEAWANGVPNVAYRAGGIAGVIDHQQDGLLVRCGQLDEFASALIRLVNNESMRNQLGNKGREKTLQKYQWPSRLQLVEEVMQQVLAE